MVAILKEDMEGKPHQEVMINVVDMIKEEEEQHRVVDMTNEVLTISVVLTIKEEEQVVDMINVVLTINAVLMIKEEVMINVGAMDKVKEDMADKLKEDMVDKLKDIAEINKEDMTNALDMEVLLQEVVMVLIHQGLIQQVVDMEELLILIVAAVEVMENLILVEVMENLILVVVMEEVIPPEEDIIEITAEEAVDMEIPKVGEDMDVITVAEVEAMVVVEVDLKEEMIVEVEAAVVMAAVEENSKEGVDVLQGKWMILDL